MGKRSIRRCLQTLAPAVLLMPALAMAQQGGDQDLTLAYNNTDVYSMDLEQLSQVPVSIATGREQPVSKAPATATVITAHDIEAMGATTLAQALQGVPGLHVSVSSLTYDPMYEFRGITATYNPQVLVLVNGLAITSEFEGNRGIGFGNMPLENVERIEVIRGPGSALYGADAFSGVINVITRTADDIHGTEFGARGGSYKERDGWVQHGGDLGPLQAAFYLGVSRTNGQKGIIQADAQTAYDSLFHTDASLAPGPVDVESEELDTHADLSYEHWRLRGTFQDRYAGMGAGLADALDPTTHLAGTNTYIDLSYENANWAPDWDVSSTLYYYDERAEPAQPSGFVLFPPGAFGNSFPQGMIGDPSHSERHAVVNWSAFYTGFARQQLRFGAGFEDDDLYKTEEEKNFLLLPGQLPINLGSVVDVTGTPFVYLTPHRRDTTYELVQDEWSMAKDWTLTAGVRHDYYSDFGNTTNPRLALVWNAAGNVVIKALHGSAFRAPSFTEQYNTNNPVEVGNPNLKPETIVTDELDAAWQATDAVQTNLALFHYHWRDIIEIVPTGTSNTAENSGNQTGHGVELESTWAVNTQWKLKGNYSFQHSIDDDTGEDAGLAPHHLAYLQSDWQFAPLWQFDSTANHVAGRDRQPGDERPRLPDYTTADLTLTRQKVFGNGDIKIQVQNVFNRDAREPSLFTSPAPGYYDLPYDLPLPGRTFYVQLNYVI